MEQKDLSKPWQHWALVSWVFVLPSTVLSLMLIVLLHFPWGYAIAMAIALSLIGLASLVKVIFT